MKSRRNPQNIVRRALRWTWIYFLHFSGLLRWVRQSFGRSSGILILTLHRVLDDTSFEQSASPSGMIVRRSTYLHLLRFLQACADVVQLTGEPPEWTKRNGRPRIAVTFDDGWKDTATIAFPLSMAHGVPITVFLCPGLTGKQDPFWPERVIRAWHSCARSAERSGQFSVICARFLPGSQFSPCAGLPHDLDRLIASVKALSGDERGFLLEQLQGISVPDTTSPQLASVDATMTWDDAEVLERAGAHFGSHTRCHEILTQLLLENVRAEIADSKNAIERRFGRPCKMFAYPNGSWSPRVRELVKSEGHKLAFINVPGVWMADTDAWLIPRINIWEGSLIGVKGTFSWAVASYNIFWRAYRAARKDREPALFNSARRA